MSFDKAGNFSKAIKCLQFELWQDCDNCCDWCYLKDHRILTTDEQKLDNINKVIEDINSDSLNDFNAIGLIGGEFFQGQLNNPKVKEKFLDLIKVINEKFQFNKIKEFWLTASLIKANQNDLFDVLKAIDFNENQRVILCTSFTQLENSPEPVPVSPVPPPVLPPGGVLGVGLIGSPSKSGFLISISSTNIPTSSEALS